jgi:ubiquinone/menaquinone biosynthesis C-methylase UbiE
MLTETTTETLVRTLEPEVMDSDEDASEYDAMDFSEPNGRFARDAVALIGGALAGDGPVSGHAPVALDIGTGTADIPLRMLDLHPSLRIVALDMADSMLRIARAHAASRGHAARLDLQKHDGKAIDLGDARFDLVMSNSVVHHIPEPVALFREIARLVRPGGAVLVRDLARPASRRAARAIVERVAANDSPKQKKLFFDSLCAALTVDEVRALARQAGLGDLRVEMVSDRHWTAERGLGC